MIKYDENGNCKGCGEHFYTYHAKGCKYSDHLAYDEILCGDHLETLDACGCTP